MSKEKSLEERMAEQEEKLNYIILQLNNLQQKVSDSNPELEQIMNLVKNMVTAPLEISKAPFTAIGRTFTIKDQILKRFPDLKYDAISKSIIAVLERKERLNISQLTNHVRKERGSASRRIVRERINKLIKEGIVQEIDEGFGRQLELIPPEED